MQQSSVLTRSPHHRQPDHHRVELSEYDESLLLDRAYVPASSFADGFGQPNRSAGPLHATSFAVALYLACLAAYFGALFWRLRDDPKEDFRVKAAAHLGVLLLALLLEGLLRVRHRARREAGYLAFYDATRRLLAVPSRAAALAQGALTLVALLPPGPPRLGGLGVSRLDLLRVTAGAELLVGGLFGVAYLARVYDHNQSVAEPDAAAFLRSRLLAPPAARLQQAEAVGAQQAEMVAWLMRRCHVLQREVLRLSTAPPWAGEEGAGGGGGAAVADLEQRLAARERELRGLSAEKDALAAQARAAWEQLEERSTAMSKLEGTAQQQAQENARLRDILEEGSRREAQLEAKLLRLRQRLEGPGPASRSASGPATPLSQAAAPQSPWASQSGA